jgi:hypothetical protein
MNEWMNEWMNEDWHVKCIRYRLLLWYALDDFRE